MSFHAVLFPKKETSYVNLDFLINFLYFYAAIRGYALSYLSSCAGRIRFLLGTPGMIALDMDPSLKGLFHQIAQHLENIPKPQGENISAITCDLSVRYLCMPCFVFVRVDINYKKPSEVFKIKLTCSHPVFLSVTSTKVIV